MSTARVLAWAGGAVTVLGLSFLFVLAASRGWLSPVARIGIGLLVSTALLTVAVRLHRRDRVLHGVLAAGGAGIAGLFVTTAAASLVYNEITRPQALLCTGAIALLSIAIAWYVRGEELAIFGVCAAMLTPAVVTHTFTGAAMLYAATIAATVPVLLWRLRWERLNVAAFVTAAPQVFLMIALALGSTVVWALAVVLFALIWLACMYQLALRPKLRRLTALTAVFTSTPFAALAAGAMRAGQHHEWLGASTSGWLLLAVSAAIGFAAAVPLLVRRPHNDLTDLLGGYALTACAAAIGLLLHGPALVIGWSTEAAALAVVAERVERREWDSRLGRDLRSRGSRLYAAAVAYLALAVIAAGVAAPPVNVANVERWASHLALAGLAMLVVSASVCSAIALRSCWSWRHLTVFVPIALVVYAVPIALSGQLVIVAWSIVAIAASAATLHGRVRRYLTVWPLLASAGAVTALAGLVTLHAFARPQVAATIHAWGLQDGLVSLVAVLIALVATSWAARPVAGMWLVAAPFAWLVYAVPFIVSGQAVVVVWCALATAVALLSHSERVRALAGRDQLLWLSAGAAALSASVAVNVFAPITVAMSIHAWGLQNGLLSAMTVLVALVTVTIAARRSTPVWDAWIVTVPVAWTAYSVPFGVSGQATVVAWCGLGAAIALAARHGRLRDLVGFDQLIACAAGSAAVAAGVTLHAFAPPSALHVSEWGSHRGLASLVALIAWSAAITAGVLAGRWRERAWVIAAPAIVLVYAVPFAVGGQLVIGGWAVVSIAAACALLERARRQFGMTAPVVVAASVAALAAVVTASVFAQPSALLAVSGWGSHDGLGALFAVVCAAVAACAAALRSTWSWRGWTIAAPVAVLVYFVPFALPGDAALVGWAVLAALLGLAIQWPRVRTLVGRLPLLIDAWAVLALSAGVAATHDRLAAQLVFHGGRDGIAPGIAIAIAAAVIAAGVEGRTHRTVAAVPVPLVICAVFSALLPGAWAVAAWAMIGAGVLAVCVRWPSRVASVLDLPLVVELATWFTAAISVIAVSAYETPGRLFAVNDHPAAGLAPVAAVALAAWTAAIAVRRVPVRSAALRAVPVEAAAATLTLVAITAAILGLAAIRADHGLQRLVTDHFQQGHLVVSAAWGLIGVAALYLGLRRRSARLRRFGLVLLFVTLAKLFVYDLSRLPATSRAASFIITGLALIAAALLMQRLAPDLLEGLTRGSPDTHPDTRTEGEG
jgi:hypothetical protein